VSGGKGEGRGSRREEGDKAIWWTKEEIEKIILRHGVSHRITVEVTTDDEMILRVSGTDWLQSKGEVS
jgi:hypothetical protein